MAAKGKTAAKAETGANLGFEAKLRIPTQAGH